MLRLKRQLIIEKLREVPIKNENGHNHLVNDAMSGQGDQAMAFLVKDGRIKFPLQQLKEEVNHMVENNLLTIEQWENLLNLLNYASNGQERVTNFLRRKRRITVI